MMPSGNTLHFINRIDETNCGDWVVSPILYYYSYFKRYNIRRHDQCCIDYDSIRPSDVVILGGGGLLDYAEFTNRQINQIFDTGATVIAWSPGINMHTDHSGAIETKIDFKRFALATLRDYNNPYNIDYLPDVTCKLPGLKKKYTVKRYIGIACHKEYPIEGFEFDTISNSHSVEEVLQFIGESEIVISNSFHMIYWALLMGKKSICVDPVSTRFYSYKYKPAYFLSQKDDLMTCIEQAKSYDFLDECIAANDAFFERVKCIIEERLTSVTNDWDRFTFATELALQKLRYKDSFLKPGDLLVSQLFVDEGAGFSESRKLIAMNNVVGDEFHTVQFDLSNFNDIQKLRFDPLEGYHCEVTILSAKSSQGDVQCIAQAAIRMSDWDRFMTTDPQYFILPPASGMLEIVFRLRLLTSNEVESAVYAYTQHEAHTHYEKDRQLEQLRAQSDEFFRTADQLNCEIESIRALNEQQSAVIQEKRQLICERDALIQNQDMQILEQQTQIKDRDVQILKQQTQIKDQDVQILKQQIQIKDQDVQIQEQQVQIKEQEIQIHSWYELNCMKEEKINQLSNELAAVYSSRSWKITAPLRAIILFFRRALKGRENGIK